MGRGYTYTHTHTHIYIYICTFVCALHFPWVLTRTAIGSLGSVELEAATGPLLSLALRRLARERDPIRAKIGSKMDGRGTLPRKLPCPLTWTTQGSRQLTRMTEGSKTVVW